MQELLTRLGISVDLVMVLLPTASAVVAWIVASPERKRAEFMSRLATQLDVMQKLIDNLEESNRDFKSEIKERDQKIDTLYAKISSLRDEKAELRTEIADQRVELTREKMYRCEVKRCQDRTPPTGI
ncbi:MAG: hypothetical protein R3Y08_08305 [Rikenellaceae bacterium]